MTKLRIPTTTILTASLLLLLLLLLLPLPASAFKHAIIVLFRIPTTNVNASPTAAAQAALRAEQSADLPTHYYRLVTITNQEPTSLSNYQVRIPLDTASLISAGKVKNDCSDIRVYSMTGSPLPYWIEDSMCNTPFTGIWTKVPSIPASGSTQVKLLYGNETMTGAADGHAVFEFFDDFESYPLGSSMDGQGGWVMAGGRSMVVQCYNNPAYKCVVGDADYGATIMRPFTVLPGTAIGTRFMVNGYEFPEVNPEVKAMWLGFSTSEVDYDNTPYGYGTNGWFTHLHHYNIRDLEFRVGTFDPFPVVPWQPLLVDFRWTPSRRLEVFVYDFLLAYENSATDYNSFSHISFMTYQEHYSIDPVSGLYDSMQYDYIYVRKAADHDPTVSVGPEENN